MPRSKAVAAALYKWLPGVVQRCNPRSKGGEWSTLFGACRITLSRVR